MFCGKVLPHKDLKPLQRLVLSMESLFCMFLMTALFVAVHRQLWEGEAGSET